MVTIAIVVWVILAKPSNKWNASVIFRLVRLIISYYSE